MGLMHVGVGEGPEVIQTFGARRPPQGLEHEPEAPFANRGPAPPATAMTSRSWSGCTSSGLRSSYMQTFRDLLDKEGVRIERETIRLPVTWNLARKTDLKILRLATDRKYEYSGDRLVLPGPDEKHRPRVGARSLLAAAIRGVERRCWCRGRGRGGPGRASSS